jgi:hypothetical protein
MTGKIALPPDVLRRILRTQAFTLIWMGLEAAVSLGAAWWAARKLPDRDTSSGILSLRTLLPKPASGRKRSLGACWRSSPTALL